MELKFIYSKLKCLKTLDLIQNLGQVSVELSCFLTILVFEFIYSKLKSLGALEHIEQSLNYKILCYVSMMFVIAINSNICNTMPHSFKLSVLCMWDIRNCSIFQIGKGIWEHYKLMLVFVYVHKKPNHSQYLIWIKETVNTAENVSLSHW